MKMKFPDFDYENDLWQKGYRLIAGLDEVGRGSIAGPLVTAAVVFPCGIKTDDCVDLRKGKLKCVNDSKKLSEKKRKEGEMWIKENALAWSIGMASVSEIDKYGLQPALYSAFRRAVMEVNRKLKYRVDYLLIDSLYIPYIRGYPVGCKSSKKSKKQTAIKKGDGISFSIAASSIIAKVHRDEYMKKISGCRFLKVYGWKKNKGYGTREHKQAIIIHGKSKHHRNTFLKTFMKER